MENPIAERLLSLAQLQVLNTKLDEIYRLRGSLPEEVNDLEDEMVGLEGRKTRFEEEIAKLREEILVRRAKIDEMGHQIKKYEDQQNNVKNNREFEALKKEIEYANLEILTSEKRIRQFGESIMEKEEQIALTDAQIDNKKRELDEKRQELEQIIQETIQEEGRLKSEIDRASSHVEGRYLNGYNKIRLNMRNGLAVVPIDRNACGGCFSIVPPQIQIDIKQRRKLIHCENCGRILLDDFFLEEAQKMLVAP
ncbi:MAG: C4-type zinc ribbon domain-containing protein [Bacteroidia bacterium]|nr:C4-type zinc ribbon domain-containing protein [Bacteroidia bacterium]